MSAEDEKSFTTNNLGSLHQLYSLGAQDAHLTKDPEFSHFTPPPVEKYHPFAIECVETQVRPPHSFGGLSRSTLHRKGSYIGNMYLEITVEDDDIETKLTASEYGVLYLIKDIRLVIGGRLIDTLTPDAILSHHFLQSKVNKRHGADAMLKGEVNGNVANAYIHLPFWFSRGYLSDYPKLSLYPLDKHYKIELEINWNTHVSESIQFSNVEGIPFPFTKDAIVKTKVLCDTAYVSEEETRHLISSHREELVEVHGYHSELISNKREAKIEIPFTLNCKDIIWCVRKTSCLGQDPDYPSSSFEGHDLVTECEFHVRGNPLYANANKKAIQYHTINPYKTGQNTTEQEGLFTHSFSMYPTFYNPSGSFSLGKSNNFLRLKFSEPFCGEIVIMANLYNVMRVSHSYGLLFT